MLTLILPKVQLFDNETQTFTHVEERILRMEHSLVSLSKWESHWEVPFIDGAPKGSDEILSYIRFMGIDEDLTDSDLSRLNDSQINQINAYITSKQTATWFSEDRTPASTTKTDTMTAEVIYASMVLYKIPFVCETWHINRLLTLIKVLNAKHEEMQRRSDGKTSRPSSASDLEARRRLNQQRRVAANTKG